MKRLYLLRHAKSSWDDPAAADFDRPLNPRGKAACKRLRAILRRRGIAPQLVLCSAARRTQETFERIASAFEQPPELVTERELYLASGPKLLARLAALDESVERVMLIGHNPGLHRLALLLAGKGDPALLARLRAKFPTAALAELALPKAWRKLDAGEAELTGLTTPRGPED